MAKRHVHALRDRLVAKNKLYKSHRLWNNKTYELDPKHCASSCDIEYHRQGLDLIGSDKFKSVIEIAAGTGLFASMFLKRHPETSKYVITDLSDEACKLARARCKKDNRAHVVRFDATSGLDSIRWDNRDLIVCTSMEHFPVNVHYEILNKIVQGTRVFFRQTNKKSMPIPVIDKRRGIHKNDHPHVYATVDYTRSMYNDCIDIINCIEFGVVILLYGIKK
jgi:SAM-dependent methyltransferase